jgi:hypothetical protein
MSINNTFQRRLNIVDFIAQQGQQTLEQIAKALGIHFSSVWRHQKAIELLQTHPISQFWSSPAGMRYLIVVFSAVIYCFGIKQGTGAESLSEFFCLIGLDGHVATSPSALRDFKKQLIGMINQYGEEHQAKIPENKPLIGGADETFFGLPILVLMELGSGYLFFEVEKESRSFESWSEEVDKHKLPPMRAMVSDGAKALLKLAIDRLHCVHLPDVFHLLRDLGQPWVSFLGRERKRLERIAKELTTGQDKKRTPKQQTTYEQRIQEQQQQYQVLEQREQIYEQAMNAITTAIHPFVLESGEWQLWQDLEKRLQEPLEQLEVLAQQLNKGMSEIETFRLHIPSLAQGLHLWWQGVFQDLIQRTQEPLLHNWAICSLLPFVYWEQQAQKTKTPGLKAIYQQAAQQAKKALDAHVVSAQLQPNDYQAWLFWGQQQCTCFQRTSSAIEGRNGALSRLHHASRGFSPELLSALTVIHNFDVRRADGTTPAERLFEQEFPSLFEWLVGQVQYLPLPRKLKKVQKLRSPLSLVFSA